MFILLTETAKAASQTAMYYHMKQTFIKMCKAAPSKERKMTKFSKIYFLANFMKTE